MKVGMKKKRASRAGVIPGRIGTKRSDYRFRAPDGTEWDSRFEWQVTNGLVKMGYPVEKCTKGGDHTVSYIQRVRGGTCAACGSNLVGKRRTYTPDLFHDPDCATGTPARDSEKFWIEVKGYLRSEERSLLRSLCTERPDLDLRFIYQRDFPISRRSGTGIVEWTKSCLKKHAAVWKNEPIDWSQHEPEARKAHKKRNPRTVSDRVVPRTRRVRAA